MTQALNHHKLTAESTDAAACNNISKDGVAYVL